MKKRYQKPNLKSVKLIGESALLAASIINITGEDQRLDGGVENQALSNQESGHDIWGNDGSSIW